MATTPRRRRARRLDDDRERKAKAQAEHRGAGRPRMESIDAALLAGLRAALAHGETQLAMEGRGEWLLAVQLRPADILWVAYNRLRRNPRLSWATPEGLMTSLLERLGVSPTPQHPVPSEDGK